MFHDAPKRSSPTQPQCSLGFRFQGNFFTTILSETKGIQRFTYQILVSNFWNDISKTALHSPSHSRNLFNMFGIIKKLTQSTIEDMITSGVRFVETNQQLTNNKSWPRFHSFAEKNKTKP